MLSERYRKWVSRIVLGIFPINSLFLPVFASYQDYNEIYYKELYNAMVQKLDTGDAQGIIHLLSQNPEDSRELFEQCLITAENYYELDKTKKSRIPGFFCFSNFQAI
ncbi:MAG: hypothetical protein ACLFQV_01925 [Vulcanimicrobiota bacterium]